MFLRLLENSAVWSFLGVYLDFFQLFLSFLLNLRPFLYKLWIETHLSKLSGDQSLFLNTMVSNPFFTERLKLFLGYARDLLQLLECFKAYEGEIVHKLL